ncbi:hypothetical protein ACODT5_16035 [Streptomyces sp. 5.8]|uniref:hypothetical protein n=1 Tax=Streptomyces sp. 5.8 TaxID=3406571 RepID=UPI003BB511AE
MAAFWWAFEDAVDHGAADGEELGEVGDGVEGAAEVDLGAAGGEGVADVAGVG